MCVLLFKYVSDPKIISLFLLCVLSLYINVRIMCLICPTMYVVCPTMCVKTKKTTISYNVCNKQRTRSAPRSGARSWVWLEHEVRKEARSKPPPLGSLRSPSSRTPSHAWICKFKGSPKAYLIYYSGEGTVIMLHWRIRLRRKARVRFARERHRL